MGIGGPVDVALHPRRGVHEQTVKTPPRRVGSVRRTSSIDSLRPDGPRGHVLFRARARDLITGHSGSPVVSGDVQLVGEVDYLDRYRLVSLDCQPTEPRLTSLVGRSASSGFRSAVLDVVPDHAEARSLLYLLLDDVPGALLVSGYAVQKTGATARPSGPVLQRADLCSGWRTGGTMLVELTRYGAIPVPTGPVVNPLEVIDDPFATHLLPVLPPIAMRRRRRIDVHRDVGRFVVDAHFRDSHMSTEGVETAIHEYVVKAQVDASTMRVLEASSTAHALPWVECNTAPSSASDIEGRTLGELRRFVRQDMTGIRTCTHLNDTLCALDDVLALAPLAING